MKTIVYFLVAALIYGIVALSFTNKTHSSGSIVIQSVDKNISLNSLTTSAKIISERLKSFSPEKFDVSIINERNQIKVSWTGNWDLNIVKSLVLQKGKLAFYESYNQSELAELLKGDNYLLSTLSMNNTYTQGAKMGCISVLELDKMNDFLNTLGLNSKCKFVWSQPTENSEICLYALKINEEQNALLTGNDVESITAHHDKTTQENYLEVRFKKSAIDKWTNVTRRNINRSIVIVVDNHVIYDPVLKSEINNGVCTITGNFTETEIRLLSSTVSHGELPAEFYMVK